MSPCGSTRPSKRSRRNPKAASITARGQQEGFHWYVETYHIASLNLLMINKSNLEKLPADLQEILISVFKEKSVEHCDDRVGVNEAELEKIKEAGVEVITPTEEAFAAFKAADTTFRDAKIAEWGMRPSSTRLSSMSRPTRNKLRLF